MDELSKQQMELLAKATPAQRAQIQTQRDLVNYQFRHPPRELPIDPDAKRDLTSEEAQKHAKSQSGKSRRTRRQTRRRRGGGPTCVYPSQADREGTETREFEEGEVVCIRSETAKGTTESRGSYLRSNDKPAILRHIIKVKDFPNGLSVLWWNVGKYTQSFNEAAFSSGFAEGLGTGAAGQGTGTGSATGPLLAASPGVGQGRRKTKSRR